MSRDRRSWWTAVTLLTFVMTVSLAPQAARGQILTTQTPGLLLGIYPGPAPGSEIDANMIAFFQEIDAWAMKKFSIAGIFRNFEHPPTTSDLELAWTHGYVPFINFIATSYTAAQLASGSADAHIVEWADAIKNWAGANKHVFIAPLPEMNGCWNRYGTSENGCYDPAANPIPAWVDNRCTVKTVFKKFQDIFASNGVPANTVRWVFAPNNISVPGPSTFNLDTSCSSDYNFSFEKYNPEDAGAIVDVVGFSAFNFGSFDSPPWKLPATIYNDAPPNDYIDRMRTKWATKPVFITQTGTCHQGGTDPMLRDWVTSAYSFLASKNGVRAVLWFNQDWSNVFPHPRCDHTFYQSASVNISTYPQAVTSSNIGVVNPPMTVAFQNRRAYTFDDVPGYPFTTTYDPLHPSTHLYYSFIETLYKAGVTGGCQNPGAPLTYCPDAQVTRAQMAVFLLRAKSPEGYNPPAPPSGGCFADVPASHFFASWICELKIQIGLNGSPCTGGMCYYPDDPMLRSDMAVFLLKTRYGGNTVPSFGCFSDVNASYWQEPWICELKARGIVGGCDAPTNRYCPSDGVIRSHMAVFLQRTFWDINPALVMPW